MKKCASSVTAVVSDSVTLWTTVAHQATWSWDLRVKYWSVLPFPSPVDLFDIGIKPTFLLFPALAGGFFTTSATWKAQLEKGQHQKNR